MSGREGLGSMFWGGGGDEGGVVGWVCWVVGLLIN